MKLINVINNIEIYKLVNIEEMDSFSISPMAVSGPANAGNFNNSNAPAEQGARRSRP